jgi:hypothetical protein
VLEQAWLLMTFMLRKEIQDTLPSIRQEVPARLDTALENYADPARGGPPQNRRTLADSIESVTPSPAHDWTPITRLSETRTPILNDIWDGKVGVSGRLRRMQDAVQRVIDAFQTDGLDTVPGPCSAPRASVRDAGGSRPEPAHKVK